jgi:hypothetical protein
MVDECETLSKLWQNARQMEKPRLRCVLFVQKRAEVIFLFFVNIPSLFCDKAIRLIHHHIPMKHILTLITVASLSSCATGPNAQRGAVIGGLGGAAVGGIVGSQSGRGLEGALIGGALGAAGGAAIGNAKDRRRY